MTKTQKRIYEILTEMQQDGRVKISQRELASILDISKTNVANCITALRAEGFIYYIPESKKGRNSVATFQVLKKIESEVRL